MNKYRKFLVIIVIAVSLLVLVAPVFAQAPAPEEPEQVMETCPSVMPEPSFEGSPVDIDWNSDWGRVYNCYDPATNKVKGVWWGANVPVGKSDWRELYGKATLTDNSGKVLDFYERSEKNQPNLTGKPPQIHYEFEMPRGIGNQQFHLVVDYWERDPNDPYHKGMERDWSGRFYGQHFYLYMGNMPNKYPSYQPPACCTTCKISWFWLDIDPQTGKVLKRTPLDVIQFVDMAKSQMNTGALYVLWSPDNIEGVISCAKGVVIKNITVKVYLNGVLFKDISDRATDGQFTAGCAVFGYRTDTMMIIVTYENGGCVCGTQKPVKDPWRSHGR